MKSTLVIGASLNPSRYSHLAIHRLVGANEEVYAYGLKPGEVAGVPILTDREAINIPDLDTITLYVGPSRQADLFDWVVSLAPKRVIFNPGTENPAFFSHLREHGIEPVMACTLVMLSTAQY